MRLLEGVTASVDEGWRAGGDPSTDDHIRHVLDHHIDFACGQVKAMDLGGLKTELVGEGHKDVVTPAPVRKPRLAVLPESRKEPSWVCAGLLVDHGDSGRGEREVGEELSAAGASQLGPYSDAVGPNDVEPIPRGDPT